jgi:hypothetical protein
MGPHRAARTEGAPQAASPYREAAPAQTSCPVGRQRLGYLFDVGFTRDTWMHRIDLAEATGKPLNPDASHDGRIITDLVAEWATTHHLPFDLELTGPAGGRYTQGTSGEHVAIDAITFARTLAERAHGDGVLSHTLPL